MEFEERRWLMSNPFVWIGAVALLFAGYLVWRDGEGWMLLWVIAALSLLLLSGAMTTRVNSLEVVITYRPFWRRRVQLSDIQSARLVPYRWLQFGGWGIRWGNRAIAYSVWEHEAIRLQLDGRDVVIGSRQAPEFLRVLRANGVPAVNTTDDSPN